jgi:hypothetical protein
LREDQVVYHYIGQADIYWESRTDWRENIVEVCLTAKSINQG